METKRISLVSKQYTLPFILVTSLFFLWGFAHAILDVLNKHFQEVLNITKTHSAFIQVTMYMGYFIMAIPAGLFINRFGYRKGVVFGLLLYGLGAFLFIPGQYYVSFNAFLFALFVIGGRPAGCSDGTNKGRSTHRTPAVSAYRAGASAHSPVERGRGDDTGRRHSAYRGS